jgi:hypothetical protein
MPFTIEQFLGVFAAYNAAIWPAQVTAYALGLVAIFALCLDQVPARRLVLSILAIMWAWNGIGYHFLFFSEINPAAIGFAALFVLQALLFAASAFITNDVRFHVGADFRSTLGITFIAYALLIYPAIGVWAGHGLMAGPMFGVTPCPTTIFTIGMLLLARGRRVTWLSIIPILWASLGLAAAVQLGIEEDMGLAVAGLALLLALATDYLDRSGKHRAPIKDFRESL